MTTWGDIPPQPPRPRLEPAGPPLADVISPREPAEDPPPPHLERTLADLRRSLDQWRHGKAEMISVVDATRAYLAALDAPPDRM